MAKRKKLIVENVRRLSTLDGEEKIRNRHKESVLRTIGWVIIVKLKVG